MRDPYWNEIGKVKWGWIDGSRYHIGYTPERIRVETRGEAVEYVPERTCHNASKTMNFRCSACDATDLDFTEPDYCHGCGAKVVKQ